MFEQLRKTLIDSEAIVQKGISTTNTVYPNTNSSNALTVRQDLQAEIVNLANRGTPLRDMVRREPGVGGAFTYNVAASVFQAGQNTNPRELLYADGGLPTEAATQYKTFTVPYVSIGQQGSVTGLAQATGEAVVDLYMAEVEKRTRAVIQGSEWLMYWSDTTTPNTNGLTGYAGLDQIITTNVVDAGGAAISKAMIDSAAIKIAQQGGMTSGSYMLFCSIGQAASINNLYNNFSQVIINNPGRDSITFGNYVTEIRALQGIMKVVPDFHINPGSVYPQANGTSSFPVGATTSTAFLVDTQFMSMKVLKELGMEELGRVADKRSFYLNVYEALKVTAEPWFAKIENLLEPTVS